MDQTKNLNAIINKENHFKRTIIEIIKPIIIAKETHIVNTKETEKGEKAFTVDQKKEIFDYCNLFD